LKILDKGYVKLIDSLGDDKRIAEVARICYGHEGEPTDASVTRLLTTLINNQHTSPLEQVVFTFKVKAPIFVARQWMRHRTGSYLEQSRRYTKTKWEYYIPELDILPNDKINSKHIQKSMEGMFLFQIREYERLISFGVKPEIARGIMGTSFYTTFFFTMDLKNLLHFIEVRKDSHAQSEMQEYAIAIELLIEEVIPQTIKIWRKKDEKK